MQQRTFCTTSPSRSITLMLCITLAIAECPHLAIKVKSFIFTYPTMMVYDGPEVHLDILTLALKNMSCLLTLKLIHSQIHHSSVLRHCDAKLRIFHCTYNIDCQLLSFLAKQDDIRDLAITADPILDLTVLFELSELFPPTSLPHLQKSVLPSIFYVSLYLGARFTLCGSRATIHRLNIKNGVSTTLSTTPQCLSGIWYLISRFGTCRCYTVVHYFQSMSRKSH
jgi:hypothetical protein